MRRTNGKRFLATLPPELHAQLEIDAKAVQAKHGGHVNMNRILAVLLYSAYRARLTPEQRASVDLFIKRSS